MPSVYQWSEPEIVLFVLTIIRITSLLVSFPIFGTQSVPNSTKILLSLLIGFSLFPAIKMKQIGITLTMDHGIVWLVLREILIGVLIGSIARFYFMSINVAGQMMSQSLGLSAAQIFNPMMGEQSNTLEQFHVGLAMLLFLSLNGHHILLTAMFESFNIIPISFDMIKWEGVKTAITIGSDVLSLGLRISAPIVVALFLAQVSMGVIGRVIPQINVLVTSLHLTIVIGLIVIFVTLPYFLDGVNEMEREMGEMIFKVMRGI